MKAPKTPVHAAAYNDQCDSLQMLLNHGGEVNRKDDHERTPLMYAAMNGQSAAIELLLEQGAELAPSDHENNTALHHACLHRQETAALLLLDKMEDSAVNCKNLEHKTPLHISARHGLVPVVQLLLSKGASVSCTDENGHTPALACAPDTQTADCLAMILNHMFPDQPGNSPMSNNVNNSTRTLESSAIPESTCSSLHDSKDQSSSVQSSDSEFY